ncbi:MAG: transposase, partial [Erysipelotrichaceae bacterium]
MNHYSLFVGIDVAMMKHDCCIMDKDSKILIKKFTFNNTLPGYQKFVDKLTTFSTDKSQIFIGLEVTGIYGDNLYERLKMDGFNII